eukprot:4276156-Ditylum_brightwellii.AAC.1
MKTKKSVGDSLIPITNVVQENQWNQEEEENCVNNDNNSMQESEEAYNHFQEIWFSAKVVKTELIMSEITVDNAAKSPVLIGKVLGHVRRGAYDIALLCNTKDDQFMEMT